VTFSVASSNSVPSVSIVPDHGGVGYLGNLSLRSIANSNGNQSVGWHFTLSDAEAGQIMPSHVLSQSYELAVSSGQPDNSITQELTLMIGGASSDTFNFKPGMGTAIVTNFSVQAADEIDLHGTNIANFAELQEMMQPIHNGHDTLIDLGHGDTLTIANVSPNQLHANSFLLV